ARAGLQKGSSGSHFCRNAFLERGGKRSATPLWIGPAKENVQTLFGVKTPSSLRSAGALFSEGCRNQFFRNLLDQDTTSARMAFSSSSSPSPGPSGTAQYPLTGAKPVLNKPQSNLAF